MAKYQTFEQYKNGEKIIRYLNFFERCWNFATEAAEEKFNSSAQSGPTNSDLMQLLCDVRNFLNSSDCPVTSVSIDIEQKVNAILAQQH